MRFGKTFKKGFIQEANRRSRLKGTLGSFNKWCTSKGLAKDGKVTKSCINRAKRSKNLTLRRRAIYAQNIKAFVGAKHSKRRSRFGTSSRFGKAKTLNKSKYTAKAGRKSPGVSATLFPVGTIKRGLDKKMWVIVQTSKGVKRWKRMRSSFGTSFGKKKKVKEPLRIEYDSNFIHNIKTRFGKKKTMFGEDIYKNNGDPQGFVKTILERERQKQLHDFDDFEDFEEQEKIEHDKQIIIKKLEKEIDLAEKIIIKYPENNSLRARAVRKLTSAKKYLAKVLTKKNVIQFMKDSMEIVNTFAGLLKTFISMGDTYSAIRGKSRTFVSLMRPIEYALDKFRVEHVDDYNRYIWLPENLVKPYITPETESMGWVKIDTQKYPQYHIDKLAPHVRKIYEDYIKSNSSNNRTGGGYGGYGGYGGGGHSSGLGWE